MYQRKIQGYIFYVRNNDCVILKDEAININKTKRSLPPYLCRCGSFFQMFGSEISVQIVGDISGMIAMAY